MELNKIKHAIETLKEMSTSEDMLAVCSLSMQQAAIRDVAKMAERYHRIQAMKKKCVS